MKYKLTKAEQETVINFDNELDTASVYTHDSRLIKKLRELRKQYPEQFILEHREHGSVTYTIPKRCVGIRPPYSEKRREQQRQEAKENGLPFMDEVTTDDLRLLLVPISKQSASLYSKMNMLIKCVFYSAEESKIISYNPAASLSAKGGTPKQEKKALTDEQVKILLDTIRGLPPYVFVMIGLYAGLRREEILALRWDCVFLDEATPYISVRRAWRSVNNRPVISTELKTPAAKRDIPIPGKLVECLKEAKEKSKSEYVISDRNGNALAESQFVRVWKYIAVRSTEERCYYTYVNGQKIKHVVKPKLGEHQPNNPKLVYTMDFQVTPHQLRHTYITNLIYASVDPKTVQYLAGHENSKVTMDIYAKVKYNKPAQLHGVINRAIDTSKKD